MRSRFTIGILLLGNLALGLYILAPVWKNADGRSHGVVTVSTNRSSLEADQNPQIKEVRSPESAPSVTNKFEWAQLEAEDYPTYIARLRSIGCPEQTIRDIIVADVDKLLAPQMLAASGRTNPPKYWKSNLPESNPLKSLDQQNRLAELDLEKRKAIRQLLGIDLAAERLRQKGETDPYEERLAFLSDEKRSEVRILIEKANREEVYLREKSWFENDELTSEEKNRLKQIQREKETALKNVLSPDELEQFNLWFSPSAYHVRDAFFGLDNTEDEFLGVYRIQRDFDSKWADVEPASLNPAQQQEYQAARERYDSDLRDFLGPERYAQYQQAQDVDYRELARLASQFDLPSDAAREVCSFKAVTLEQRGKVQNDPALSPEQRESILRAISEESQRAVVEVIGPKAYKAYLRSGAGRWISE